jgi:nitrite reductase/ring-hydroxylating ferredoxin subunit
LKQLRRVFLKVFAAGPLVGCGGSGPEESPPGAGGAEGSSAGAGVTGGSSFAGGGSGTTSSPILTAGRFGGPPSSAGSGGTNAAGGMNGAGGSPSGGSNPGIVVANLSSVPVGSFAIAGGLYFLGRDAEGLFAMSMQCTHQFCAVVMNGEELRCPCHDSRFDREGNVLRGPATTPLPHYAVFVDDAGNISVDKFDVVSANTRTPV